MAARPSPPPDGLSALNAAVRWAVGGGLAVFLGALVPFDSPNNGPGVTGGALTSGINGDARLASALFGLALVGLAAGALYETVRTWPKGPSRVLAVLLLGLSALGLIGYVGFAWLGLAGFSTPDGLGGQVRTAYSPNIGLYLSILGCAAAIYGAIRICRLS